MRIKIYNALVNKHAGISFRYHRMHDGAGASKKMLSWVYLFWLNFCYYVLFCHWLDTRPNMEIYEEKRLLCTTSESAAHHNEHPGLSVDEFVEKLRQYDIVSFDIFDTLIFRPLNLPTDVFYLIGEKLDILDFKNIRFWAEMDARGKCYQKNKHTEISLEDIWKNLQAEIGIDATFGQRLEESIEQELCYANPFMLEVWNRLIAVGQRIIICSDMYLSSECLEKILQKAGYSGYERLFVSCEYKKNKATGQLFEQVKQEMGEQFSYIHVGDNPNSDQKMAQKAGFAVCPYPKTDQNALLYRPYDMSALIGSAYRALVSNHLYNGLHSFTMEYEYGYIYGGLFAVGYCNFIHDYAEKQNISKVLFLSRDGDILKQVYDRMYPGEKTEYVYWSRKAATKLMAAEDKHDYFRRFIYHKVNQNYKIRDILASMELGFLEEQLSEWPDIWKQQEDETLEKFSELTADEMLTDKNCVCLRRFIEAKWNQVSAYYADQMHAAKTYYAHILNGCDKVLAVDIGWAGSGAVALSHLVEKVWKMPCTVIGMIAGTNTIHNAEPDASEPFLQSGRLVVYLYSQAHNRDLLKKHDPNKDYNVFWELLLSSPTPQFTGFYGGKQETQSESIYLENLDITLVFGKYDKNQQGIKEIQKGIWDFADQYMEHFAKIPYMMSISGRDAYAPMLLAAGNKEQYLKTIENKFMLEINVN